MLLRYLFPIIAYACIFASVNAANIHCPSTDINSPSFHSKEMDQVDASGRMKIKYYEQFGLVKFDISQLKGKNITEAWLQVHAAGGHKHDLNNGTDLTWISVSTVSSNWDGKKACANHNGIRSDWAYPGAHTYDVACGHGNTLRCNVKLEKHGSLHRAKLDPSIVHALVSGASHGIFIMDGSTHYSINCRVTDPILVVTTNNTAVPSAGKVSAVKITPAAHWATRTHGAITVKCTVPKNAFSFDLKINGKTLPRWQIPFAQPGTVQEFQIVDLDPGKTIKLEIIAKNKAGIASASVSAKGKTSPALTVPTLPSYKFTPKAGAPQTLGPAKIYAFPELTMIDPINGQALHENSLDFSQKNPIWDGSTGTVRLASAKAESISFQIAIQGHINDVAIKVSDLKSKDTTLSSKRSQLWRNWYVGTYSEYALPLSGTVNCPMADNKIDGQTLQAVTVDLHIPKTAQAGLYTGTVTLSSGGTSAKLKLQVHVYDVTIPDEIFFNPEMNCYRGPGTAGSQRFNNSFKLAHYHRSTINRVPYSQSGNVHKDWSPDVGPDGKITDWSRFDTNIGPLLDGSLFKDNPRAGVPVASLYLPHFEGWPLDFRKHYNPGLTLPKGKVNKETAIKHHILAKPIEEAMSPEYKKAWINCVSEFYKHLQDKKWTRTVFQCYLNNKSQYGYSLWNLDEPSIYRDWEALNFWASLWKQGINDPEVYTYKWMQEYYRNGLHTMNRGKPVLLFRGDISRMNWQGNLSNDLMNLIYIGGGGFDQGRLIKNSKKNIPAIMYAYGRCPDYKNSKWETAAWCVKAFVNESNGVLPWQSINKGLNNPDPKGNGNSLIVDAGEYGDAIASFRVHAFRRGAQDCELLRLLMLKKGWSRQHMGLLVSQKVPLGAEYTQKFNDEAAAVTFGKMSAQGFCEMKEGILQLLTE